MGAGLQGSSKIPYLWEWESHQLRCEKAKAGIPWLLGPQSLLENCTEKLGTGGGVGWARWGRIGLQQGQARASQTPEHLGVAE